MGEKFALYHAFTNVHTPLIVHQRFTGASPEHGPYGDSVIELDHQVSTANQAITYTAKTLRGWSKPKENFSEVSTYSFTELIQ